MAAWHAQARRACLHVVDVRRGRVEAHDAGAARHVGALREHVRRDQHAQLQQYVSQSATLCIPGCNPMYPGLQPYVRRDQHAQLHGRVRIRVRVRVRVRGRDQHAQLHGRVQGSVQGGVHCRPLCCAAEGVRHMVCALTWAALHVHVHVHCVCVRLCMWCACACACACVHVVCMCVCACACVHVCARACVCTCVWACACFL